jgi:hypothetical protein
MWGKTKRVPILGWMAEAVARPKRDDEPDAEHAAMVETVQKEIDRRIATPAYVVEVKHIGGPDDPTLYEQMVAREEAARHAARVRARRAVESDGVPHTTEAVSEAMGRDPVWHKDLGAIVRAWIHAGLVDGEKEYLRVYALGEQERGGGGGSRLLLDAALEVKKYQGLTEEEGKN